MIGKTVGRGFVLHKHAYLREPWNMLDFVVVILGCEEVAVILGGASRGP